MRLIDADAIFNCKVLLVSDKTYDAVRAVIERINNAPTVDAVEVVRCKDCKWYKESKHLYPIRFCYRLKNDDGVPVGYNWADNDFCSYGERREDETG